MAKSFTCSLVTPERSVLQTEATYADLPAHDGQMGVMSGRAAMVVKLGVGRLTLEPVDGAKRQYVLDGGFAQMSDNKLTLLCERAYGSDEITMDKARSALAAAEALPMSTADQVAQRDHDLLVARHMVSIAGG